MQTQVKRGAESVRNEEIITAPMKGSSPRVRFIILYLPVLCIMYPANREPKGIATLFGTKCQPISSRYVIPYIIEMNNRSLPAVEALVIMTVWNHSGKK